MKFIENQLKAAPKGIAVGQNKGHIVTKRAKVIRHANRKGFLSQRVKTVRAVIRDTCGFTAYERRIMELLKGGGNNPQKRAYKYAKMKLGAHTRARSKVKEMEEALAKSSIKKTKA